jgi:hypothetical protein
MIVLGIAADRMVGVSTMLIQQEFTSMTMSANATVASKCRQWIIITFAETSMIVLMMHACLELVKILSMLLHVHAQWAITLAQVQSIRQERIVTLIPVEYHRRKASLLLPRKKAFIWRVRQWSTPVRKDTHWMVPPLVSASSAWLVQYEVTELVSQCLRPHALPLSVVKHLRYSVRVWKEKLDLFTDILKLSTTHAALATALMVLLEGPKILRSSVWQTENFKAWSCVCLRPAQQSQHRTML